MGEKANFKEYELSQDWEVWFERLEQYYIANDIEDGKKVPILLTLLNNEAYMLLRDLATPVKPPKLSLIEVNKIMSSHLKPKPSEVTERYKFKDRKQRSDETINEYLAQLKKLSLNCNFTDLEVNLRDQLVCGVMDDYIKKRLLSEPNLTYKKAVELAISFEATAKEVEVMSEGMKKQTIHYTRKLEWNKRNQKSCYRCKGTRHLANECYFRNYQCRKCGKMGHIAKACRVGEHQKETGQGRKQGNRSETSEAGRQSGTRKGRFERVNFTSNEEMANETFDYLNNIESSTESYETVSTVQQINDRVVDPVKMKLNVEHIVLEFEVDTGSNISCISEDLYYSTFKQLLISKSKCEFRSYANQIIPCLGFIVVKVNVNDTVKHLKLFIFKNGGPYPLLGRQWLSELGLSIHNIVKTDISKLTSKLVEDFPKVLTEQLGCYYKEMHLNLTEESQPIFLRPHTLPYMMKDKVNQELDRLSSLGILEPVDHSDWGTPFVPVIKNDNSIRIAGNFKLTINKCLRIDKYPIPKVEELLNSLTGAAVFTKLDISDAYNQIKLDESSKSLLTISTHRGLFRYQRLVYGVASGPGWFQREMEKLVQGIPGVIVFIDDILISGETTNEVYDRTCQVLERMQKVGLTLKKSKCTFFTDEVSFLGHKLNKNGIHMETNRIKAVLNAPVPENIKQLQAFIGTVNYYGRFIKDLSIILKPVYTLLGKNIKWEWSEECNDAFKRIKEIMTSEPYLVHYNPSLPLRLTCDASSYGLAAVLSHVMSEGEERAIAYASRTLSKSEQNYSQLDKETLSLIYGVKKFHSYIYGREFELITDHKPLIHLLGPKKGIPIMAANRLQRWAIILSGYNYKIKYVESKRNGADGLSRIPLKKQINEEKDVSHLNFIQENVPNISVRNIQIQTRNDPILSKVKYYMLNGWPKSNCDNRLGAFFMRRDELTLEENCIMWGYRIVIPTKFRQILLKEIHSTHLGIVKTKMLARSYFWWPNLDQEIEGMIKGCNICLQFQNNPPKTELSSWKWPEGPSMRLHADLLGPLNGKMYLIILDAYSKWVEVFTMNSISADQTISKFRDYFSRWGLPITLVTDNGTQFCSHSFELFLKSNGISHVTTPIYSPYCNGAAENAVKTIKTSLKKILLSRDRIEEALPKYLFAYRITPHCTTSCSPAELQMGRQLRSRFSLMMPCNKENVSIKQSRQKKDYNGKRSSKIEVGDGVMVKDYRANKNKWSKATVIKKLGNVVFLVKLENGKVTKRHLNQISTIKVPFVNTPTEHSVNLPIVLSQTTSDLTETRCQSDTESDNHQVDVRETTTAIENTNDTSNIESKLLTNEKANLSLLPNTVRRSNRPRKPVTKLDL